MNSYDNNYGDYLLVRKTESGKLEVGMLTSGTRPIDINWIPAEIFLEANKEAWGTLVAFAIKSSLGLKEEGSK